jgi:glutamine cyclotransferase
VPGRQIRGFWRLLPYSRPADSVIIDSMRNGMEVTVLVFVLVQFIPARSGWQDGIAKVTRTEYEVVGKYPHDPEAYTQGLVWYKGGFYESTGLYGRSSLRRVEFPSGKILRSIHMAPNIFAEGLALVDGNLVQLTWKSGKGFVYDRETFKLLREFQVDTVGWGLAFDGSQLILSDGSSTLTYMDPATFRPGKKLNVTLDGKPLENLNELEFIEGEIWSNVWMSDLIVRIDPASGRVTSYLDMRGLLPFNPDRSPDDVLNGIAFDPENRRIFVGGKRWPSLFEIRLKPAR